ncbi:lipopolysaccharide biosynthesis protein, partial [Halorussus salinisoli]|uniref:lipopolysaccharide biosynthesis protein n=1 Tax=Halorussus salinisoli TaxID=2558242 RepID=UPI0010C234FB
MSRSITRGFVSVLGTKLVILMVGIVSSPLLATLLGESDYGDYSFLLSVFSIFMIFVSSGVTDGVQKFLGEERADSAWQERVVGFYFRLAVLLGLAGAGALAWFAQSDLLFRLVDDEGFRWYFYLLGALVVAAQFRSYARRTLMGFGLEPYAEAIRVTNRLTFVAAGLALAYLGYGVEGVLAGHIVGSTLSALVGFGLIARRVSVVESLRIAPRSFPRRELLSFNGLSIVLVALLMSMYHVDVMMIRVLVDGPATAFYKVALVLAEFLWVAPMALQTVLLHSTSKLWSQGDHERISQMTARITRYSLLFTALLAVGIGSLAPVAVPMLWPDNYVASLTPLYLLLPGAIGFAVARPILAVGQGKGDLPRLIAATGAAALTNVVLNWVLINQYGMHGAAVATSISYGSMFFLHVWSARSLGFDPLADARLLRVGVTIGVGAPLVVALSRAIASPYLALAVVPVGGVVIFASLALITGALGLSEVLEVASSLPVVGPKAASLERRIRYSSNIDAVQTFQRVLLFAGVVLVVAGVSAAVTGVPLPIGDGGGADVPLTTKTPEPTETPTPDEAPPTTEESTPTETASASSTTATDGTTTGGDTSPGDTTTATTTEESGSSGGSGSDGGSDSDSESGSDSGSGSDGGSGSNSGSGSDSGSDSGSSDGSSTTTEETTTENTTTETATTTAETTTETTTTTTADTTTETTTEETTTENTTTETATTTAETTTETTTQTTAETATETETTA